MAPACSPPTRPASLSSSRSPWPCRKTAKVFGSPLVYEYRNERAFVSAGEREALFQEFLANFKKDVLPYVSKDHFPKRFVLSKYHEIVKDPWKYPDQR